MRQPIFTRSNLNPILKPFKKHDWESKKVYNPGAIYHDNKYHLFYRAVGYDKISRIGYTVSNDGENFTRLNKPILSPKLPIESSGLEDPRITKVGNKFFLTYTAYDGQTARLCLATSLDLKNWQRQGEMLPNWDSKRAGEFILPWDNAQSTSSAQQHWLKAGAIFPEKINGKYWLFFGDRLMWQATSKDGRQWIPEYQPIVTPRPNSFDSVHVEAGPPPIRTDQGWLMLYHGVDETVTYRLGLLLLDLHNPLKILKRSKKPIFEPNKNDLIFDADTDIGGNQNKKPQIIFCNSAIKENNNIRIYYGASDSVICTATAKLDDIISIK